MQEESATKNVVSATYYRHTHTHTYVLTKTHLFTHARMRTCPFFLQM